MDNFVSNPRQKRKDCNFPWTQLKTVKCNNKRKIIEVIKETENRLCFLIFDSIEKKYNKLTQMLMFFVEGFTNKFAHVYLKVHSK